ncbi:MAG: GAF domain-containing sensor histidine kinase [Opitutaceae bacterium]|nr:GAF domain-containing sensor histidine kinase [Cytophagales bacterium]
MTTLCCTHSYNIPKNDEDRLKKLYRFDILDTLHENVYDRIAKLASDIFGTPGSLISFVDQERVWYKANTTSIPQRETPRQDSLCSLAILNDGPTVFQDTFLVPELDSHPLVHSDIGIRFYAAAPIRTFEGYNIGAICVVDYVPREVTEIQITMLETLAAIVVDQLEQRLSEKNNHIILDDLMEKTIHNLKSPLSAIKSLSEEIPKSIEDSESVIEMAEMISEASTSLITGLNELKEISKIENGNIEIHLQPVNLEEILTKVMVNFEKTAWNKGQNITLAINTNKEIKADKLRVREIFDHLLSNAIKYSYPNTHIRINVEEYQNKIRVEFCDEGQGLSDSDKGKLFTKFARLSSYPTARETSTGLGLSIVKMLVDLHQGKIWAESEGKDKGSKFTVEFPVRIRLGK